ncbi:MAG: amino acid racemase [Proteobacteria bacterium]|nr:amino acid racemase [Pseudomonadota bacterium]MBU1583911.1 amino acid racemase [Pseudomonadota bacterium]MBU2452814.1 amino acid racemase [Pseudomonadota bacterium]MBU2627081.1 amino acid racemase [Pseudomonadota bacterium]
MTEKIVGIIGGMGPEATVDLMQRIIDLTPALDDMDHIRCVVDNNPKVPSRIKAIIEGDGEDPGPCMADMAKRLEAFGADFLVIACNTAHYYYDAVQQAVRIPVINLIDLVAGHIKEIFPEQDKIGILASPAVAMTKLYTRRFESLGIKDIWPDPEYQDRLFTVIKGVKKKEDIALLWPAYKSVCENLLHKGVQTAVIACTELSIINGTLPIKTVDAADILAKEIIRKAKDSKDLLSKTL